MILLWTTGTFSMLYGTPIMDELFTYAHKHLAPAAYAAHTLPREIFLLTMLLEEHMEVMRLRGIVGELLED